MNERVSEDNGARVAVWDLPTRLFKWLFAALVATSLITGETGDMDIHVTSGLTIIALVLFRLGWGLVGGRHARFTGFVRGPGAVLAYARDFAAGRSGRWAGHNPLGGLSVLAMLAVVGLQAGLGLFSNDDILTEGPLMHLIEKETSDYITGLHETNGGLVLALIVVHIGAVALYLKKGENLIKPMLRGWKTGAFDGAGDDAGDERKKVEGNLAIALVLIVLAGGAAWCLTTL